MDQHDPRRFDGDNLIDWHAEDDIGPDRTRWAWWAILAGAIAIWAAVLWDVLGSPLEWFA